MLFKSQPYSEYKLSVTKLFITISTLIFFLLMNLSSFKLSQLTTHSANFTNLQQSPSLPVGEYGRIPLTFEANQGQVDESVQFLARGNGFNAFLTNEQAILLLDNKESTDSVFLTFEEANNDLVMEGVDMLPGKFNYFIGDDPERWHTNIPTFSKVAYHEIYDGIDLIYYSNQGDLEYDFIISPEANPNDIQLSFSNATEIKLDSSGNLLIVTSNGHIEQSAPLAYQLIENRMVPVESQYNLLPNGSIKFDVGNYDKRFPLIIDPILQYSSYIGGIDTDSIFSLDIDSNGNAYIVGRTLSTDFPSTAGAFDTSIDARDAFVIKLDSSGSNLIYATFIGGSSDESGFGIDVDSSGNTFLTGGTRSTDFPVTAGAFDLTRNSTNDSFILKLDSSGSNLIYSSYLGGGANDDGFAVMTNNLGQAHIVGFTQSSDYPTTVGSLDTSFNATTCTFGSLTGPCRDIFVTKMDATGASLLYSTYLGGSGDDFTYRATLDGSGNVYVMGMTDSTDFPTSASAYDSTYNGGLTDAFVAKIDSSGANLLYGTYLGGSGVESSSPIIGGIAVDAVGNAYITGLTGSSDYPTTAGAFDESYNGQQETFVTKLNTVGSSLVYSTFIGGVANDYGAAIDVDSAGNAYVTGNTSSGDMAITSGAVQPSINGQDAYLIVLNNSGTAVTYGTYLGGAGIEIGGAVVATDNKDVFIAGISRSTDFPITANAYQQTYGGGFEDGFITKLRLPCTVTTLSQFGTGSIDEAINCANNNPGPDTIVFAVAGTINISGSLPDLSDLTGGTLIDGTTAPGYAGAPVVVINGSGTTGSNRGLRTTSADNEIRGLQIVDFAVGIEIEDSNATNNRVTASYIGTDGVTAVPNQTGIIIDDAPNNIIGTDGDGVNDSAEGNVISGNNTLGIQIIDPNATNNRIAGNIIGADATGTSAIANLGTAGIQILNGNNNIVGTNGDGVGDIDERNIVSGNADVGVMAQNCDNCTIAGNYIGTDINGTAALPNGTGSSTFFNTAVLITGATINNIIGTNGDGIGDADERNIVSGNASRGIQLSGGSNAIIANNYVGLDSSGNALGNGQIGIFLQGGSGTVVGTNGDGNGDAIEGNVVSNNGSQGIFVQNTSASDAVIAGNIVGLDPTGTSAMSNGQGGIEINLPANGRIGTNADGVSDIEERNIISGNTGNGISIYSGSTVNTVVAGNFIGTDISGTIAIGNTQNGIGISSAPNGRIGGVQAIERNIISGNSQYGIQISGGFATGNTIQGNYIGLDVNGTAALGNTLQGVLVSSENTLIGGTTSGAGNVISGNANSGVTITSNNNQLYGNLVGTNATGLSAIPNASDGLVLIGDNNTIGGASSTERNVFSGNQSDGISIASSGNGNTVLGNYVGVDTSGTVALPNVVDGIIIGGANNFIGGSAVGEGNVISGNLVHGIRILGSTGEGNIVQGNFIGTDNSGTVTIGNGDHGIRVSEDDTLIGGSGAGEGNIIANNGNDGIAILSGNGNSILGNSIFNNAVAGINLTGTANNSQVAPSLTSALTDTMTDISGTLASTPSTTFTIEFFSNSVCDSSGFGEGETFIGSDTVLTNGSGSGSFLFTTATAVPVGNFITATATDPSGNTSQFSNCIAVVEANSPPIASSDTFTGTEDLPLSVSAPGVLANDTDPDSTQLGFGDRALVVNQNADSVTIMNVDNDPPTVITTIPVGNDPLDGIISPNGRLAVVTNNSDDTVSILDMNLATPTVIATLPVGSQPTGVAISPDNETAVVANANTTTLSLIDLTQNPPVISNTITVGSGLFGEVHDVVFDTSGDYSVVAFGDSFEGQILVVDMTLATPAEVVSARIPVGNFPIAIGTNPNRTLAVVNSISADETAVINLSSFPFTIVGTLSVGPNPGAKPDISASGIAVVPDADTDVAYIIDAGAATPSIITTIAVGDGPRGAGIIDGDNVALVANRTGNSISRIDLTSLSTLSTINGITSANRISIHEDSGDVLTAVLDTTTSNGTLTLNSDGSFDYMPDPDFCGLDSFTYHANDGSLDSNIATVTIDVICENDDPVVAADNTPITVDEGQAASNSGTVSDVDGDTVSLTASVGIVTNNGNGTWSWSFTTDDGSAESQTVTIDADDGNSGTSQTTFDLVVNNIAPTATFSNSGPVDEGNNFSLTLSSPNDPSSADTLTGFEYAFDCGDGVYSAFSPTDNTNCTAVDDGTLAVRGQIRDKDGGVTEYIDSVTVNNLPPVSADDNGAVPESGPALTIDVLINDSDPAGLADPLTIISVDTTGTIGLVTFTASDVTYDPNGQFESLGLGDTAVDTFSYTIDDGDGGTAIATVTITINGENDAPTVGVDNPSVTVDEGLTAVNSGTISDIDGDTPTLTASIGIIIDNGNDTWSWSFTTDDGPAESQTVTIDANDGNGGMAQITFDLIVDNVAPSATFTNDGPVDETNNFTLTLSSPSDPSNADTVTGFEYAFDCGDGIYSPFSTTNNATCPTIDDGVLTVRGQIRDKDGDVTEYTGSVTVNNLDPTAGVDVASASEDGPAITIDVLINDSDPAGLADPLSIIGIDTTGTVGSVIFTATDVTYDPNGGFETLAIGETAVDTFTYTIDDGDGGTDTAVVTITINGQNDAPTITVDNANVTVDEGQTANNSGTLSDPDSNDSLLLTASIGIITDNGNGTWSWSLGTVDGPAESQIVTITIDDGTTTDQLTFDLVVNNVAPTIDNVTVPGTAVQISNQPVNITIEFSDFGVIDTHTVVVEWGDTLSDTVPSATSPLNLNHTYAAIGTYNGTITITDNDGGIDTTPFTIIIEDSPPTTQCDIDAPGVNIILGTPGNDNIIGTNGDDVILGFGGRDIIEGRGGNDCIEGGDGWDDIFGGAGQDLIFGGKGQDWIFGNGGADTLYGGNGADLIVGGGGSDLIYGEAGYDDLEGNGGDDEIYGGAGADYIIGNKGSDQLFGEGGADILEGNQQNDALDGGNGFDDCYGGGGTDTAVSCEFEAGIP